MSWVHILPRARCSLCVAPVLQSRLLCHNLVIATTQVLYTRLSFASFGVSDIRTGNFCSSSSSLSPSHIIIPARQCATNTHNVFHLIVVCKDQLSSYLRHESCQLRIMQKCSLLQQNTDFETAHYRKHKLFA